MQFFFITAKVRIQKQNRSKQWTAAVLTKLQKNTGCMVRGIVENTAGNVEFFFFLFHH